MNKNITIRNSNIELLRIISILMIVVSHYTVHNGVVNSSLPIGFNRLLLEITVLGNIGAIIFVLITGYYSIDKAKPFKFKKLILLIFEVSFYSTIIYLMFVLLKLETFSVINLIKNIFPITFKQYWFMTAYIVLYIFAPFINIFLNNMNRKQYINFIVISLLIFSILHMITTSDYYGNELIQFILFYSLGGYLKKYNNNIFSRKYKLLLIVTSLLLIISVIIFDLIGIKINIVAIHSSYFYSRSSIISILFSVSLFILFLNMKINNRIINYISQYILGVYLISDNNYVRNILWSNILQVENYVNSPLLIFHMISSVLLVFIICIIIDFIRKATLEKLIDKMYDYLKNKIVKNKLYIRIQSIFLRYDKLEY